MIALFTALIAPYFVDWSTYKKDFERETSRIIGQSVEVLGETKVRLLPVPSVTFGGLVIGKNIDGTPMMTVDQFALDIELMPMLKGEVSIVELKLVRPRVNLHVDDTGVIAWTNRQELAVNPKQIKLENFSITNGEIKVHGLAGGRTLSMEQLDGRISAKSLYGPWRIKADGYLGNKRARVEISTGRFQEDGSIRIRLSAQQAGLPYKLSLDGSVRMHEELLRWDGDYQIIAHRKDNRGAEPLPVLLQGKFGATPRVVEIPEFRLEIGDRDDPYTITGTGSARIGETIDFDIKADGRQIDLDRISNTKNATQNGDGLSLEKRLTVLRDIIEKIPVPKATGTIDLSLPAIVAGDTVIREVNAIISPDNAGWKIHKLGAVFPGNTKFEARGKVGLHEAYGFTGKMLVASLQPTGLAAWLGKRNNPFIRKLRSAGFTADVVISENQASLENLELVLDAAVLKGKLQRLAATSGQPAIIARLEGEEINLDDLRAIFALTVNDDARAISNHDLDINLKAAKLTGFDISAENVETRFRVSGGTVSIEKLSASNFFGATISSSGRIDDLLRQPQGNFKLAVRAKEGSRLLQFAKSRLPKNEFLANLAGSPELVKNLDLVLQVNSRKNTNSKTGGSQGQAIVIGEIGGTSVDLEIDFTGEPTHLKAAVLDTSLEVENENPAVLLRQMNIPVLPVDVDGPLNASINFSGALESGFEGFVSARFAGSRLSANGRVNLSNKQYANMEINVASSDIDPLLLLAGLGVRTRSLDEPAVSASFSGAIELSKNRVVLKKINGQIKGSEFDVDLEFENNHLSNRRVSGKLKATELSLPFLTELTFSPTGFEISEQVEGWSQSNIGPAIFQGLDGQIELEIGRSDTGLSRAAKNITGNLDIVDGSVNLNQIKADWLDGKVETSLSFTNAEGIASLSAQFNITGIKAGSLAREMGVVPFVHGTTTILGSVEGSGRSIAAIVSSLVGSGTAELNDVKIPNLNTNPLAYVFDQIDREGFEIQDQNVLPVIEQVIDEGELDVEQVSIPFIVAGGKIRARNIAVEGNLSKMTGAFEVDVARGSVVSELSVRFDPGKEWVEGTEPQIIMAWAGDITKPVRSIDVQPLSGYLSLRNFEREQRRVDLLQASILEKQRLRREIIVTNARVRYRQRLRDEELRRQRQAFLRNEEIRNRALGAIRHREMLEREQKARDEAIREAAALERERLAQEARIAEEIELNRLAEEARIAEEIELNRLAEEARIAEEMERKRLAAEVEQLRLEEEAKKAGELERKRIEAVIKSTLAAEQERAQVEAAKKAEENRKAAELARALREQNAAKAAAASRRIENASQSGQEKPARLNDSNFAKRLNEFLDER